jgi:acetyl esterase/lipase
MNDFRVLKNIIYKTVDGIEIKGDIYLPEVIGKKPAVLVVHGGSWASRAGDMTEMSRDLAGSGFVVFNIAYRLAPESLYPKAVEDIRDAIQFMRNHGSEFEIDPNEISAWGYSAGSQLVLMAGLDPMLKLKAIVAGGTPADFTAWPYSPIIRKFTGKTFQEAPELWKEASPVNHVESNSPPVFLYHGHNDHLVEVEQMYRMRDALTAKNVEVKTYEVPILGHIFVYLFSQKSLKLGVDFIKTHTHPAFFTVQ